jgi:DNA-binding transcriptional MocR family regulator
MWTPKLEKGAGPVYLAVADAIAADVATGRLQAGTKLPTQRSLAQELGVDFTTITRAYQEAGRRGLVDGRVGQGTFVKSQDAATQVTSAGLVDMSMNLPPIPVDERLMQRMWETFPKLQEHAAARLMMRYQEPGGSLRDRMAGVRWLSGRVPSVDPTSLLVAPGAQGALTATVATLAKRGDVILTEALSYPGFISLAAHLGIRITPVASDDQGISPESLAELIVSLHPKALYCTPTLHNPTTKSWSTARRQEVVSIVAQHGLPVIEDDAYGALPEAPLSTLAALVPDLVYHIASLSKCLAPALRIAYLVAPDSAAAVRLAGALRGTTAMASPLTAALATQWIDDGLAAEFLQALRMESRARQALVTNILPAGLANADPEGFHAWLTLPDGWSRGEFISRLRSLGVSAVGSDAFAVDRAPEAARLGLGGASTQEELARSLNIIAALLIDRPAFSSLVV